MALDVRGQYFLYSGFQFTYKISFVTMYEIIHINMSNKGYYSSMLLVYIPRIDLLAWTSRA
jgi:hypothetical protein